MAWRSSQYRASKFEMKEMGIPDDYIDALLDDAYMERLIVATNHINAQRGRKLRRYFRLQVVMLSGLVLQALLGLFVTYYKTFGQPDTVYRGTAKVDNVDMVLMLDSAGHNIKVKGQQHETVKSFTRTLMQEMANARDSAKQKVLDKIEENATTTHNFNFRDFIPFIRYILPDARHDSPVSVFGGHLRIATGLFAHEAKILHNFTRDVDIQKRTLDRVDANRYASNAQWHEAIKACNQAVMHGKNYGRGVAEQRFCVIIGDNEAMCERRHSSQAVELCRSLPGHRCPEDFERLGSVLESSSEMKQDCTRYVTDQLVNDLKGADRRGNGTQLIMMLLVKTQQEEQVRLRSENFRQYLADTTGCVLTPHVYNTKDPSGNNRVETTWNQSKTCNKFIMARGYDDLKEKAKAIASMLNPVERVTPEVNGQKDDRYYFFLLLPLNLVFYVIWSKLVQLASIVQQQTQRVMGQKKKMVKVTKTLVEKERRKSTAERFAAQLTELEMAEVSALRAPIEAGEKMTLRARLKGGYVRASADGLCDGNGRAFDPSAEWTFECVNQEQGEGGCLQVGHKVRIRNAKGRILRVDAEGAAFGGDLADDEAAQFVLVHPEGEDMPCHLGDTIRLRSVSTGKYFAVHKDGRCDGTGDAGDPETQLDIDRGGPTVNSGTIITLNSVDGNFLCATPDGQCQAGVDNFRYWLIEHKDCPCSSNAANGGTSDGRGEGDTPDVPEATRVLHQGDIVTLKAFTQSKMVADGKGRIHCGAKPPSEPSGGGLATLHEVGDGESEGGELEPTAPLPETQDFMIERVGMGLLSKNDNTIRRGARICLKPVRDVADRIGDTVRNYVKLNDDGTLTANGSIVDQDISFTLNAGAIPEMVAPLNDAMMKGDVTLSIHPLWNKSDVRRLDALSAAWMHDSDLQHFKGAVVVANSRGAYTVPKAQGEHAWVAVVNEGVDLHKAAAQAKSQGATGLIIRCEQFCSLDNLNMLADAEGKPPVLPTVFVDNSTGKELDEKGLVMIKSEFKKKYLTTAMRAIGRAAAAGTDPSILTDVHAAVGAAMVQRHTEEVAELDMAEDEEPPPEMPTDDQGKYKWKVTSNTYYLWTKSGGGGATRMNVNYGKKLPPMMITKVRTKPHNQSPAGLPDRKAHARGSLVGVTLVDSSDLKNHRLADELSEVLTETEANEPLEQLSDESDFKIEYTFEEVEIAVGDTPVDIEEDDLINEEGAVISHLAVPVKKFWLVVSAVLLSTFLILCFLFWVLTWQQEAEAENLDDMDMPHPVEALVDAAVFAVLPQIRSAPVLGRFLSEASP